jgi:hypothetical protein
LERTWTRSYRHSQPPLAPSQPPRGLTARTMHSDLPVSGACMSEGNTELSLIGGCPRGGGGGLPEPPRASFPLGSHRR